LQTRDADSRTQTTINTTSQHHLHNVKTPESTSINTDFASAIKGYRQTSIFAKV